MGRECMKINKPTFGRILERAEQKNSERLMAKARLANRIAKGSRSVNRRTAYYTNQMLFVPWLKKLSLRVRVFKDVKLTNCVVVELKTQRSRLHLPFARLAG